MITFQGHVVFRYAKPWIYAKNTLYNKKNSNFFLFTRGKHLATLSFCGTSSLFQKVKNKSIGLKDSSTVLALGFQSKFLYSTVCFSKAETNLKSEKKTSTAKRLYDKSILSNTKRLSPNNFLTQTTLKKHYRNIVCEDLILKQNIKNIMELPKIIKLVINTSSKLVVSDKKNMVSALIAVEKITSQKIKKTQAKKSIAAFKLRENQLIGCKVTLRGDCLFTFLEKVVRILLPRIRDFEGLKVESFDYQGNPNIGINGFLFFAELESYFEFFGFLGGINLSLVASANKKQEVSLFTSSLQFPSSIENQRLKAFLFYG